MQFICTCIPTFAHYPRCSECLDLPTFLGDRRNGYVNLFFLGDFFLSGGHEQIEQHTVDDSEIPRSPPGMVLNSLVDSEPHLVQPPIRIGKPHKKTTPSHGAKA